ncbi:uncharacterized protein LOC5520593 isoform X2 [Nematostella vectensis]|uniref:uncharacterized protein LOC5520593 isoform X2 n=1 Tax=Nematostella vectensis TaxID=45351 RepID=UPI0020779216|nr:uncharacterized protein LOC5520593 isoform X2 [Nematostella vectensis]
MEVKYLFVPLLLVLYGVPSLVSGDHPRSLLSFWNWNGHHIDFWHVGCFKDTRTRALPFRVISIASTEPDTIVRCANVTWTLGYDAFGVQNGGECWTGVNASDTYDKYGVLDGASCGSGGKGGRWANDVYFLNSCGFEMLRCYEAQASLSYQNLGLDSVSEDDIRPILSDMLITMSRFLGTRLNTCKAVDLVLGSITMIERTDNLEIDFAIIFTANKSISRDKVNSTLWRCSSIARQNTVILMNVKTLEVNNVAHSPKEGNLISMTSCCARGVPPPCCPKGSVEVTSGICACLPGYGREKGGCALCKANQYSEHQARPCKNCPPGTNTWGRKGVVNKANCTGRNPINVSEKTVTLPFGLKAGEVVAKVTASYISGSLVIPPLVYAIRRVTMATDESSSSKSPKEDDAMDFFSIDDNTGEISITKKFNFSDGVNYVVDVNVSDSVAPDLGVITRQVKVRFECRDVCKRSRELYQGVTEVCTETNVTKRINGVNTTSLTISNLDMTTINSCQLRRELEEGNYVLWLQSGSQKLRINFTVQVEEEFSGKPFSIKNFSITNNELKVGVLSHQGPKSFSDSQGVTIVGIQRPNCQSVDFACKSKVLTWRNAVGKNGDESCGADPKMMLLRYGDCVALPTTSLLITKAPSEDDPSVTLLCTVKSPLSYNITWYHNNVLIPDLSLTKPDYGFQVTRERQGNYACVAESIAGMTRSTSVLVAPKNMYTWYLLLVSTKKNQPPNDVASKVQSFLNSDHDQNRYSVLKKGEPTDKGRRMEFVVYETKDGSNVTTAYNRLKENLVRGASDELKQLKLKKNNIGVTSAEYCFAEATGKEDIKGKYNWQTTKLLKVVTLSCFYNHEENATRICIGDFASGATWQDPMLERCQYKSKRTRQLHDISQRPITNANAKSTADELKTLLSQTPAKDLNEADASLVADTLDNLVDNKESLNETGDVIVFVVSDIMKMDKKTLSGSKQASTKIVKTLDTLVMTMPLPEGQTSKQLTADSLTLQLNQINISAFSGLTFSKKGSSSVQLPITLFQAGDQYSDRVGFIYYGNNKLFQVDEANVLDDDAEGLVTSDVILSCSVYNTSIRNLSEPVALTFPKPSGVWELKCVYWVDNMSIWSNEGCHVTDNGGCACNHLTSFAMIFSPPGQARDGDDPLTKSLTIVSYVGCAISLVGVLLTLLTYSLFRHLRKTNQQPILINLCIALGLLLVVFLAGASRPEPQLGCQIVAVLLHYLTLAVVLWMGVEGYNLYLQIVQVMATYQRRFMLKAVVFAWGVPAVIVAITATVAAVQITKNPGSLFSYGSKTACILYDPLYYWIAWFAPVLLTLTINIVVYALVVHKLGCTDAMVNPEKKSLQRYRVRTALAIMVLLGLTWLFGALSFGDKLQRVTFEYLFCIFNSLQGLFIFIFHCLRIKEVRNQWKFFFSGFGISHRGTSDSYQRSKGIGESHHSSEAPYAKVTHYVARHDSDLQRPRKETVSTIVAGANNSVGDTKDFCGENHVDIELKDNYNTGLEFNNGETGHEEINCDKIV